MVLLNRGAGEQHISVNWEDLGYPNTLSASVRDLWQHKDLGKFTGKFSGTVASHGVVMITVLGCANSKSTRSNAARRGASKCSITSTTDAASNPASCS